MPTSHWAASATLRQHARASSIPCCPVPALALPALISKYRGEREARCERATQTGAAAKRLRVNATLVRVPEESSTRTRSLRCCLYKPALATASLMPLTGNMDSGLLRLTLIGTTVHMVYGLEKAASDISLACLVQLAVALLVFLSGSAWTRAHSCQSCGLRGHKVQPVVAPAHPCAMRPVHPDD